VLDLYCGIGTLTLAAARLAKEAIGIEIIQKAIENARKNAADNGIQNARFICGAAEQVLPELLREERINPQAVLLDPPRKGCEAGVIEAIAETGLSLLEAAR
jgi:23S rRNA (uracil1939-C5)-methyltransferase